MTHILLDVDDTLYDQLTPFNKAYQELFGHLDVPVNQLFIQSRYYSEEVFDAVSNGEMDKHEMHIYRISKAFAYFGIEISREEAERFQGLYAKHQKGIELAPEMEELLNEAKARGLKIGIITNGPGEHQANKVEQLQMRNWVDENHIFISGKLGIAKPSTEIFRIVEDKMGIKPEHAYYFGDSYGNDVVGAKKAGWNAVWVNRRKHTIPSGQEHLPDYRIDEESSPVDVLRRILGQE
ncbi:HAD family hydrolase [Halobacillus locisalis]|uniref:HAD family hydrolase n=1 Tax=Halobacillus locisalis TaxID=220753 RepID=A0A838CVJ1_9BACI|nr:HAD family hydrolase [Halobacillus locisalis]MBA2175839.1 HAD family hydrolase [Halobacillus locisalis]